MKFYLFIIGLLFFSSAVAQNEIFYLFDANDKPVAERGKAATFEVITKESDTLFVARYYQNYGPMIWQQMFKDSALTVSIGRSTWYDNKGNIKVTSFVDNKKENEESFDSAAIKQMISNVKTNGKKIEIEDFSSSKFPPQIQKSWIKYFKNNLNIKTGQYNSVYHMSAGYNAVAVVSFTIMPDKTIDDIYFLHSEGYPYDKEILRVIKNVNIWLTRQKAAIDAPLKKTLKISFPFQYQ